MKPPEDQWPDHKVCTGCKIDKSLVEFNHNKNGRYRKESKCRVCSAGDMKAWRQANPGYMQVWHDTNHGHEKEYKKVHKKTNRERYTVYGNNRRARIKGLEGSFTAKEWERLLDLCEHRCVKCGVYENELLSAMHMDHIIPSTEEGSTNWITNIQPLCGHCNDSKNNRNSIDYRPDSVIRQLQQTLQS